MSNRRHRKRCQSGKGIWHLIDQVVDGLNQASGLGHGIIIAGFVCGFIFVPLLTAMVFFVTLYWVRYPVQARRQLACVSSCVRRIVRVVMAAVASLENRNTVNQPPSGQQPAGATRAPMSTAQLRAKFEALDKRANAIEAFVSSQEYLLEREFKQMGDTDR